jgi:glycosyltransferase involved in cell wall biosynthesis
MRWKAGGTRHRTGPFGIAVVVPTLQPAGAERVALALSREFAKSAHVTLVTFDPRLSSRALARADRVPWSERVPVECDHVHLPAASSGVTRLAALAVRFARLARRRRFDVVYSFLTYSNILVALSRMIAQARYVHVASEHAMADTLCSDGSKAATLARTLPVVYRAPHRLVVVSDAARSSLITAGAVRRPDRAVTIYNPVDVRTLREKARVPVPSPSLGRHAERAITIACFARLHAQKDHRTVLRALSLLPPAYCLLVVGDGPLRERLERMAADLGVADRTTFVGAVDDPYPMMQQADVVVLASVEEGFGLVALEAAALGVPFVGSDIGGLAELCGVLGHPTFPHGDATELAAAIARVTAHAGAPVPLEQLRQFDVAHVAHRYLELALPAQTPAGFWPYRRKEDNA